MVKLIDSLVFPWPFANFMHYFQFVFHLRKDCRSLSSVVVSTRTVDIVRRRGGAGCIARRHTHLFLTGRRILHLQCGWIVWHPSRLVRLVRLHLLPQILAALLSGWINHGPSNGIALAFKDDFATRSVT